MFSWAMLNVRSTHLIVAADALLAGATAQIKPSPVIRTAKVVSLSIIRCCMSSLVGLVL